MNTCKDSKCSCEVTGKQVYCSGACRQRASRASSVTDEPVASVTKPSVTRPPCTAKQLTSTCLTCVDKPTCEYLHNMNSAKPGDKDYSGVCVETGAGWQVRA